jgi:hypothetical protein
MSRASVLAQRKAERQYPVRVKIAASLAGSSDQLMGHAPRCLIAASRHGGGQEPLMEKRGFAA